MARALHILFGAGFSIALAWALGSLILRGLAIRLARLETDLFAFLSGAAGLSVVVFLLCLAGHAKADVFLAGGLPILAAALWLARRDSPSKSPPAGPLIWQLLFYGGLTLFSIIYFLNALAPEVSPDGAGYHLGNVVRMSALGGFDWNHHSIYSYFPQGLEMLFLVAFSLGGRASAALVHAAFLGALPLSMAAFGRRFGLSRAGMAAGLLVFASPVAGIDGASAYNDVALAALSFAAVYAIQLNIEVLQSKQLFLVGLLCGFCFAIKYTGWLALPIAFCWSPRVRSALWILVGAAVTGAPWLLRDWIWLGNPFAPFLNRWFPNPFYYPGPEQSYLADLRHYEVYRHWWQLPVDLSMHGASISGIVGPVFLLAPVAFLALRHRIGRMLLLSAILWTVPAWFNSGARFLIPSLPFLALGMALALENSWGILPALAVFQLWACWPSTLAAYAAPWSWRLREIPVKAAFGRVPEATFLAARLPDYAFRSAMEREVAPHQKIFSYEGRAEAYLPRTIVVGYESALGLLGQDELAQAVAPESMRVFRWTMPPQTVRGVRIAAQSADLRWWKVSDVRLANQGGEVRPFGWRFSASPNPWQAGLAFDGSPVTRWSTWEPLRSGDFLQAEFPQAVPIDAVSVEASAAPDAHPLLEVASASGVWQPPLGATMQVSAAPARDLRKDAMNQLKARGIFYLLINDSDLPATDLKQHTNQWGVTLIQEANGTRFYRID